MNFSRTHLFLAAATALALVGCGGGGSPSDEDPNPGPSAPVVESGAPVSYMAGSTEAFALQSVNAAITHCGYKAMSPVADLTIAAAGHANYILKNGWAFTHFQTLGAPGFTGIAPADRIKAAGASDARANAASEGAEAMPIGNKWVPGVLYAPYHQANLLSQWTEIGVGTSPVDDGNAALVLNYGGEKLNAVPTNDVRSFPCEGSVDVRPNGGPETPDPFPGLNGLFGPGMNFETNKGGKIVVDSISLRNESTGEMVEMMEVTGQILDYQSWRAVYASRGHLNPATSYRVEARGKTFATTNGNDSPVAWMRNYSFKTMTY